LVKEVEKDAEKLFTENIARTKKEAKAEEVVARC